ncbi:MAG: hypothetical protein IKO22_00585 [Oscillospiraceae bacterium]|nr:hypothetical protein [Oscillospiraceae bacterium]
MKHVYTAGRRLSVVKTLSTVVNCAVVFVFYFIYRFLFAESAPNFVGWPLAAVFVAFAILVVFLTLKLWERYGDAIQYKVTADALLVGKGEKTKKYPWNRFAWIEMRSDTAFHFEAVFPAIFHMKEETLVINHYVGDSYGLAGEIVEHIQDQVTIPPELRRQISAMRGLR